MSRARWSRWGRGSCEGYSLDIGDTLRGQVVLNVDGTWRASLTATDLGRHATKEAAQAEVEMRIKHTMRAILEDWATY